MPIMPIDVDPHDPIIWNALMAGYEAGYASGRSGIDSANVPEELKRIGEALRRSPLWPPAPSWDERERQLARRRRRRTPESDLSGEQLRRRAAASWGLCDADHHAIVTP